MLCTKSFRPNNYNHNQHHKTRNQIFPTRQKYQQRDFSLAIWVVLEIAHRSSIAFAQPQRNPTQQRTESYPFAFIPWLTRIRRLSCTFAHFRRTPRKIAPCETRSFACGCTKPRPSACEYSFPSATLGFLFYFSPASTRRWWMISCGASNTYDRHPIWITFSFHGGTRCNFLSRSIEPMKKWWIYGWSEFGEGNEMFVLGLTRRRVLIRGWNMKS